MAALRIDEMEIKLHNFLMRKDEIKPPIEIPAEALSPEAFSGIINEFILREGTDYGSVEISHEKKMEQIQKQLAKGDIKIIFDTNTESVTLMTKLDFKKLLISILFLIITFPFISYGSDFNLEKCVKMSESFPALLPLKLNGRGSKKITAYADASTKSKVIGSLLVKDKEGDKDTEVTITGDGKNRKYEAKFDDNYHWVTVLKDKFGFYQIAKGPFMKKVWVVKENFKFPLVHLTSKGYVFHFDRPGLGSYMDPVCIQHQTIYFYDLKQDDFLKKFGFADPEPAYSDSEETKEVKKISELPLKDILNAYGALRLSALRGSDSTPE